ncbi:MAG: adenine phosphoribosyltransferase, partial [Bacillota bacterium]
MNFKDKIRIIPDFPKPGIRFKDITTLLKDGQALRAAVQEIANRFRDEKIDLVVGPEARGFVIGTPVAYELGCGFVP